MNSFTLVLHVVHRPGREIPAGVAANRAAREAWRREIEAMRDARGERRRVVLSISAGRQTTFGEEER